MVLSKVRGSLCSLVSTLVSIGLLYIMAIGSLLQVTNGPTHELSLPALAVCPPLPPLVPRRLHPPPPRPQLPLLLGQEGKS